MMDARQKRLALGRDSVRSPSEMAVCSGAKSATHKSPTVPRFLPHSLPHSIPVQLQQFRSQVKPAKPATTSSPLVSSPLKENAGSPSTGKSGGKALSGQPTRSGAMSSPSGASRRKTAGLSSTGRGGNLDIITSPPAHAQGASDALAGLTASADGPTSASASSPPGSASALGLAALGTPTTLRALGADFASILEGTAGASTTPIAVPDTPVTLGFEDDIRGGSSSGVGKWAQTVSLLLAGDLNRRGTCAQHRPLT
jgi:hypothetical protein